MSLDVPFIGPPEKKSFSKLRAPWLSTRCRRAVINRLACGLKHWTTLHMLLGVEQSSHHHCISDIVVAVVFRNLPLDGSLPSTSRITQTV